MSKTKQFHKIIAIKSLTNKFEILVKEYGKSDYQAQWMNISTFACQFPDQIKIIEQTIKRERNIKKQQYYKHAKVIDLEQQQTSPDFQNLREDFVSYKEIQCFLKSYQDFQSFRKIYKQRKIKFLIEEIPVKELQIVINTKKNLGNQKSEKILWI